MKKKEAELTGVKEIARLANVSIGTVDRVIHNRKGVSDDTRQKINTIIDQLGYKPNTMASLLAKKKQIRLAVLIPQASAETDYWSYPLDGVNVALSEVKHQGINLDIHFYDLNSKEGFHKKADELLQNVPDGLILAPSFVEESVELVAKLKELAVPMVFINSDLPNQEPLSYIGPDLFQSGRLAAQLLGFILGPADEVLVINISTQIENNHHLKRKEGGFRKYFEENGYSNRVLTLDIHETKPGAVESSLTDYIALNPKIKALFVTNSRVSRVAQIVKNHNLGLLLAGYDFLPENVKHLSGDHLKFLICQRPKEQGYLAVMALYKHFFNVGTVDATQYMPIDIITKENYMFYKT